MLLSRGRFFVLMGTALIAPVFGQAGNSPAVTASIAVSVVDRQGETVRDLTKENFRARVNGKPAEVLDAHFTLAPRRVFILLDGSKSMGRPTASPKWQIARDVVQDLLTHTAGDVPIGVMAFASGVRKVFGFSESRDTISNWLKDTPSERQERKNGPRTALFDAISESLKLLAPYHPGDTIYAITDGADTSSTDSATQVKAALLHSHVRLFAFYFAGEELPGPLASKRDDFLKLVEDSGGSVFKVAGQGRFGDSPWRVDYVDDRRLRSELSRYNKEFNLLVHAFWTLDVSVPVSNRERAVQVELVNGAGKHRGDLKVSYPRVLPVLP